uniref:GMC_oxred_C domain-containing protein n=1 Tax=Rhabditophanes sp. KR3021 TaxID=114890 RepID=A0AC35TYB7_9BILA
MLHFKFRPINAEKALRAGMVTKITTSKQVKSEALEYDEAINQHSKFTGGAFSRMMALLTQPIRSSYVEADIQGVFGTERINGIRVYSVLLANNSPAYLTTAQIPKNCHYMVMDLLQCMTTINS